MNPHRVMVKQAVLTLVLGGKWEDRVGEFHGISLYTAVDGSALTCGVAVCAGGALVRPPLGVKGSWVRIPPSRRSKQPAGWRVSAGQRASWRCHRDLVVDLRAWSDPIFGRSLGGSITVGAKWGRGVGVDDLARSGDSFRGRGSLWLVSMGFAVVGGGECNVGCGFALAC